MRIISAFTSKIYWEYERENDYWVTGIQEMKNGNYYYNYRGFTFLKPYLHQDGRDLPLPISMYCFLGVSGVGRWGPNAAHRRGWMMEYSGSSGFMAQLLPASDAIFDELCPLCEPQFPLCKMGLRVILILWGSGVGSMICPWQSSRPSIKFESEKFTWHSEMWEKSMETRGSQKPCEVPGLMGKTNT